MFYKRRVLSLPAAVTFYEFNYAFSSGEGGPRLGVPRSERSRALGVRGERWKEFLSDFVAFKKLKSSFSVIPSDTRLISGNPARNPR